MKILIHLPHQLKNSEEEGCITLDKVRWLLSSSLRRRDEEQSLLVSVEREGEDLNLAHTSSLEKTGEKRTHVFLSERERSSSSETGE